MNDTSKLFIKVQLEFNNIIEDKLNRIEKSYSVKNDAALRTILDL